MRPTHPSARPALSPAICRTLGLFATGLYTSDVADRLGEDQDTVRHHLTEAMAILGARSKLEAVVGALQLGLIEVR